MRLLRSKRFLFILFIVSVVCMSFISIAFASLSTTLNITTGNVTQNVVVWDVGFVPGTYNGVAGSTGGNSIGLSCGSVTATQSSLSFGNSSISKPGDLCSFSIDTRNNGDFYAYVQSVTLTAPTSTSCTIVNSGSNNCAAYMICGKLKYTVSPYSSRTLAPSASSSISIVISYVGDELNSSAVTQSNGRASIIFTDNESLKITACYS